MKNNIFCFASNDFWVEAEDERIVCVSVLILPIFYHPFPIKFHNRENCER